MAIGTSAGDGSHVVTGIFSDSESVERAADAVARLGYGKDDLNVVMSDATRQRYLSEPRAVDTDLARKPAEGGELGGPTGGRIGILLPVLAAVGTTIALSGVGLIAAGPIAAALAGAGAAGLAAGLIGALADWGLPEERVRLYESELKNGGVLVGLKARSPEHARRIGEEWTALGGRHVHA
jgi:hypothetical protein